MRRGHTIGIWLGGGSKRGVPPPLFFAAGCLPPPLRRRCRFLRLEHKPARARFTRQRLHFDQVGGAQVVVCIEMKLDEARALLADSEGAPGAERASVDEHVPIALVDVLLVVVTGEDEKRRTRPARDEIEERMRERVAVPRSDGGADP